VFKPGYIVIVSEYFVSIYLLHVLIRVLSFSRSLLLLNQFGGTFIIVCAGVIVLRNKMHSHTTLFYHPSSTVLLKVTPRDYQSLRFGTYLEPGVLEYLLQMLRDESVHKHPRVRFSMLKTDFYWAMDTRVKDASVRTLIKDGHKAVLSLLPDNLFDSQLIIPIQEEDTNSWILAIVFNLYCCQEFVARHKRLVIFSLLFLSAVHIIYRYKLIEHIAEMQN
jgi:hypothetical protein